MSLEEAIKKLKQEWSEPRSPLSSDASQPDFRLACKFAENGVTGQLCPEIVDTIPDELRTFWSHSEFAKLFEDMTYGQWGLQVLSPAESVRETTKQRGARPNDFGPNDLVVGRFLGDSDLLVVHCDSNAGDFGSVMVALPLDPREGWYRIADSFEAFFEEYANTGGEKYWELQP